MRMLQRAASNAYSWWWASHIRTKQSKWLEQNLQDMEEKVNSMLNIIDNEGDTFAERAEMYYKKRPELTGHIEESFRAYRALAERYDKLSKELQGANRTIASIFPERVHCSIDDDDDDNDGNFPEPSTSFDDPDHSSNDFPDITHAEILKVPKFPKVFRIPSMIKKAPPKRNASTVKAIAVPKSGLSEAEAVQEIDKLQKEILALQTEMEFMKNLYERGYQKYWEIEHQITEMQKRVSSLQDEFGTGSIIDDHEARTLMASTVLKTCHETLMKLQEKQGQSAEEATGECSRIKEVIKQFESIRDEFLSKHPDRFEPTKEPHEVINGTQELKISEIGMEQGRNDTGMSMEDIKEQNEANANDSLTVSELVEKIDELVNKVVTLETEVSSQTSLVNRLKSETDELQTHIWSLEEDKENLIESAEQMSKKLKELEEELNRVKNLNRSIENRNNNLQIHFTEASSNLDHLSGKLHSVKLDEKVDDNAAWFNEERAISDAKVEQDFEEYRDELGPNGASSEISKDEKMEIEGENKLDSPKDEEQVQSNTRNYLDLVHEKPKESMQQEKNEKQQFSEMPNTHLNSETPEYMSEEENQPNWRKLFVKGLEDRENILLDEYTSVLRDYKDVRNKLSEVEKKNRNSIFELAMQMRELKNAISAKDGEIKLLRQNVPHTILDMHLEEPHDNMHEVTSSPYSDFPPPSLDQDSVSDLFGEHHLESSYKIDELHKNLKNCPRKEQLNKMNVVKVDKPHKISTIEKRFRSDIDELLEKNLEFWLRFSTSLHQIQKFQTSIQDLQAELLTMQDHKKRQRVSAKQQASQSDARPIYRHLREIQTELSLWLEHNAVLKDELQSRFSSLCNIQDEISRVTNANANSGEEKTELSKYQAAKFQGEILNMKQENNKIADELELGLSRVRGLQAQVKKTLDKLDEELGISATKNNQSPTRNPSSRVRIPLRSFLFGVKLKKQKQSNFKQLYSFSCVNPALQKQYSDLGHRPPH